MKSPLEYGKTAMHPVGISDQGHPVEPHKIIVVANKGIVQNRPICDYGDNGEDQEKGSVKQGTTGETG